MSRHDDPARQPDVRPLKRARERPTERERASYTVQVDFVGEDQIRNAPTAEEALDIIARFKRVEALASGLLALHDACGKDLDYVSGSALAEMERILCSGWRYVKVNESCLDYRIEDTDGYDRPVDHGLGPPPPRYDDRPHSPTWTRSIPDIYKYFPRRSRDFDGRPPPPRYDDRPYSPSMPTPPSPPTTRDD